MILGYLRSAALREYQCYLRRRTQLPLRSPKRLTREDTTFAELRRAVPKPPERERRRVSWISEETWRVIDVRISLRRESD